MTSLKEIWANKNYRTSGVIALALVIWLASGLLDESEEEAAQMGETVAQADENAGALTTVRGRYIYAQPYPLTVAVTAQTEANRLVDLRAELAGQVESLPVKEGARVETGDVICRLAVEDREQRLVEAEAAVEQAQIDYDGAQRLETGGFQSKTAIANAKARLEAAKANLLRRKIDLEKTQIRAPFAGIVEQRPVEIGDLMRPGDTCATIIDLDPLVVSAEASEAEVVRISEGEPARMRFATGEQAKGEVTYISRRANENTRTFRVEVAVNNPDMRLLSGITADMNIEVGVVPAHLVPSSLLILDERGELGLRVLNDEKRVEMYNVELVGDAGDGVWVTGLPESTLLITVGHQYVGVGEQVAVSLEDKSRSTHGIGENAAAMRATK
ncbi:efflux RND transporter periplasmic adaptor subunit [Proteobacteria bacterium 005FR1]|nr:efflux RND transporter periplasmic adaptor subunit [Proteobacteria bacterium 005FR1]